MAGNGKSNPAFLPPDFPLTAFEDAIDIRPAGNGKEKDVYIADLKRDWCIGLVPHGGYILSLLTRATTTHHKTQHPNSNQPDIVTAHVEFLSRSTVGKAEIHVLALKLGRQFSNFRVNLYQSSPKSKSGDARILCVEALITLGNLKLEAENGGIALETHSLPGLEGGIPERRLFEDWKPEQRLIPMRPAAMKMETLYRSGRGEMGIGEGGRSVREQWVRWGAGGKGKGFDGESLGYLCDAFRPVPENYGLEGNWYPTLSYGLDVKKAAPPGGWEWLFLRAEIFEARNGRFGIDVVVCEEGGEVVCTSRHVALILGGERNVKGRL